MFLWALTHRTQRKTVTHWKSHLGSVFLVPANTPPHMPPGKLNSHTPPHVEAQKGRLLAIAARDVSRGETNSRRENLRIHSPEIQAEELI